MTRTATVMLAAWLVCGCGSEADDGAAMPAAGTAASAAGQGGTQGSAGRGSAGSSAMMSGGSSAAGAASALAGASGNGEAGRAGGAGSGAAGSGTPPGGMPMPSSGCGTPWMPADAMMEQPRRGGAPMLVARRSMTINGTERVYLLAVPPSYDPSRAYPLIFGFHGSGGDREQLRGYMNVETPAAGQAIFIYPQGLPNEEGVNEWDTATGSDDLMFFDMLRAKYTGELCIDQGRLFATGHSFGGCMSNAVGCFRGDVLRAIAPVAGCGPFVRGGGSGCVGRVATLQIHSPLDTATRYSGAISACTRWLRANGCSEMPMCGCHWTEELGTMGMACDQQAQHPYEPGVAVEPGMQDDAPPVLREYESCMPGYPVVFIEHHRREREAGAANERWHNPPPWSAAVIWEFFSKLEAMVEPGP